MDKEVRREHLCMGRSRNRSRSCSHRDPQALQGHEGQVWRQHESHLQELDGAGND